MKKGIPIVLSFGLLIAGIVFYQFSSKTESKAEADGSVQKAATADWVDQQVTNESKKVDATSAQVKDLEARVNKLLNKPSISDYKDVSQTYFAAKHINYLLGKGIVKGYPDKGMFFPDNDVTRYQAAAMILKAKGIPLSSDPSVFTDIDNNSVYRSVAMAAYKAGIFHGSKTKDGKLVFRPKDHLTRAEMAIILSNAFDFQGTKDTAFTPYKDVAQSYFAYPDIKLVTIYHIAKGKQDGTFAPNAPTTRAQFSIFLTNTIDSSFRYN